MFGAAALEKRVEPDMRDGAYHCETAVFAFAAALEVDVDVVCGEEYAGGGAEDDVAGFGQGGGADAVLLIVRGTVHY